MTNFNDLIKKIRDDAVTSKADFAKLSRLAQEFNLPLHAVLSIVESELNRESFGDSNSNEGWVMDPTPAPTPVVPATPEPSTNNHPPKLRTDLKSNISGQKKENPIKQQPDTPAEKKASISARLQEKVEPPKAAVSKKEKAPEPTPSVIKTVRTERPTSTEKVQETQSVPTPPKEEPTPSKKEEATPIPKKEETEEHANPIQSITQQLFRSNNPVIPKPSTPNKSDKPVKAPVPKKQPETEKAPKQKKAEKKKSAPTPKPQPQKQVEKPTPPPSEPRPPVSPPPKVQQKPPVTPPPKKEIVTNPAPPKVDYGIPLEVYLQKVDDHRDKLNQHIQLAIIAVGTELFAMSDNGATPVVSKNDIFIKEIKQKSGIFRKNPPKLRVYFPKQSTKPKSIRQLDEELKAVFRQCLGAARFDNYFNDLMKK